MKKQILGMALLGCLTALAAATTHAQSGYQLRGDVPFQFGVKGQTLPAGGYVVERVSRQDSAGAILIRAAGGGARMYVLTVPAQGRTTQGPARLIFRRYGDRSFLAQVWAGGEIGLTLPESRAERELRRELRRDSPRVASGTVTAGKTTAGVETLVVALRRQ